MKSVKVGEVKYRIVCSHFGQEGHSTHVWGMGDRAKAEQAKRRHDIDEALNRPNCTPWTVEARAISEWGDPDAAEMCLYAIGRTIEGRML